jgi:Zn-finger protein
VATIVKCNRCGEEEIRNVEEWLLEASGKVWQCQKCFFKKPDGSAILAASPMLSDVISDVHD